MATDVSIRFKAESAQARKEVQNLRGTLTQLNRTLVENRSALLTATGEERKRIQAVQAANAVQKAALQQQIREAQTRKQVIAELQRETRERERAAAQQERAAERSRQATLQLVGDVAIVSRLAARQLGKLTGGFVTAAAGIETFRNTIQSVTRDAGETDRILRRLLDVSVDLVGIDTRDLINYAGRLMAIGLSSEEAITAITGVTERLAEQGRPAAETRLAMEQVTQSFNTGRAVMFDFRTLMRLFPRLWDDISNALGKNVRSTEDFNKVAEASGGHTQTLLRALTEMQRVSEGADISTLNAQLDILNDQSRVLQSELGNELIPAIVGIIKQINVWIEEFRNLDDETQATIAWASALATGLTALTAVVSGTVVAFGALSASLAAITGTAGLGGVATLAGKAAGGLGRVVGILGRLGSVGNLAATAGITLAQAWQQIYNDFQRTPPFEDAVESIEKLDLASSQIAQSLKVTAESLSGLSQESRTEIELLISRADELRTSIRNAVNAEDTGALTELRNEYRQITQQLESLTTALPPTVEGMSAAKAAISALAEVTPEAVRFQKELTGEIITAEQAHRNLTAVVDSTNLGYNDFQSRIQASALAVAGFTGVIEGVQEPFTAYTAVIHASNAALEEEAKALATVTQRIIQQTQDAEALVHIQEVLTERTDAHNAALVNPIVTQAAQRIRAYATALDSTQFSTQALTEITSDAMDRIREFTDAVLTSEGVLNNFAPALGEVETRYIGLQSVTDRVTASIRDQASAFDELRQSVERFNQSESQRRQERGIRTPRLPAETIDPNASLDLVDVSLGRDPASRRQTEKAERAASEAQRESIQLYNDLSDATVDFTSSLIDLQAETNLADRGFQDLLGTFGRLAAGDFTALLDIPIQLANISRQAAAEREQGAQERAARNEASLEGFSRFGRNFSAVSGVLGIPESPELSDSLFFNPAGEFENVLAQSTADFSDGIKNALLASVINLERDIRPEDIAEIFQSGIDRLGESLALSQFNLNFDEQLGRDTADAYNALISDTTAFYQAQIDVINLVRQTTGNLSFGDPEALARASQAATNQARLQLADGPQNAQQFLAQTGRTRGLAPGQDDQERGVVFDPNTADILAGISDLDISNLQGIADDAIAVFRDAITAPARTIESINTAFEEILPDLRTLYDNIREQIIGTDGIISDAEQIQLNNLGSFEDFTQQYANLRDQAIEGVNATQQRLAITSQQIATGEGIRQFGELANAPNATIEELTTAWNQNVLPLVNALYDDLFAQIAGPDGFINTADEQIAFLGLGSREDFVSDYENNILNPALNSLTTIEQNIAQLLQGRELENTFDNFNDAILAPGQTLEGLTAYWESNVVPTLRETYNGLRANIIGDDGLTSPAELEQLISMGLDVPFEDWAVQYEDGLLTPGLDRLQTAAAVIASITQNREQEAIIEMFNEGITAPGQTIDGLNTFWIENVVPVLRETYDALRAEVIGEDGIISPEEAAQLTQAGLDIPFENWVSPFEDNILTPGIDRLSGAAAVIASVMQNREESNIIEMFNAAAIAPGATIEGVNRYWIENVVPVLQQTYESLRNDIIGEDGLISPEEVAELVSRGLDIPFEDWVTPYENDIRTPAIDSLSAAAQIIASVTQSGEQSAVIEMFNNAVKAPGATVAGLTAFWQSFVVPELRQTYESLRADIIGEDGLISPQELAELTEKGLNVPFEDWAGQFENDILTPGIDFLKGEAEYLQSTELSTGVDNVVERFKEQVAAPGATIAALTQEWNDNVVPALRALYQDLYDDIAGADGLINTAREEADLLKLGNVDDFVTGFTSDIFTPLTTSLQSGRRQTRSNLAGNQVNQARFNLRESGSESEFEDNREILLQAIAAFYDAEEERIRALGLSADQLTDQLQDLDLSRRQATDAALSADNTFASERIRTETRVADQIADLRDKQADNEQDRQQKIYDLNADTAQRLLDLEEDTQEKIDDIRRKSTQSREDVEREFSRDIEDILRGAGADEFLLQPGILEQFRRVAQSPDSSILESFSQQFGVDLSDSDLNRIRELSRERLRDIDDIGIRDPRQIEDAQLREARSRDDINERAAIQTQQIQQQAEANATAIEMALTPLLEQTANSPDLIQKQVETATLASETAKTESETAAVQSESAGALMDSAGLQSDAAAVLEQAGVELKSAARVQGLVDAATALQGAAAAIEKGVVELFRGLGGIAVALTEALNTVAEGRLEGVFPENFGSQAASMPTPEALTEGISMGVSEGIGELRAEGLSDRAIDKMLRREADADIYDPARIEELRAGGLNNRVIGHILREAAAVPEALPTPSETLQQKIVETINISAGTVNVSGRVSGVQETANPGILPMGVPVGGPEADNRLFHFAETDAIANRLARQAAFQQPRRAPNYLPDANQIRNSRDVSREIVSGLTEGLSQRKSGFGNEGTREQPQTIVIENKIQMPSGVVKEIGRTQVELSDQGDFVGVSSTQA